MSLPMTVAAPSTVRTWRPYPAYKDSGVEWLGEIPAHWEIRPLKYATQFINGAPFKPGDWDDEGVPIVRIENLNGSEEFNRTTLNVDARFHVRAGDLLFAWSGNRGTSFGPFVWEREGLHYLNQHIFRLQGFHYSKAWFYWVLRGVTAYVETQAHGIIGLVHITKEDLGAVRIPTAPEVEQQAIATFLDRETARIDTLVAQKERLIALLREKRAALISHAVTKGLDPAAPMRDSGIESVGSIPDHWETRKNKTVFREADERSAAGEEELLSVSHITGVTPRREKEVTMFMAESLEGYKLCRPGDLVVNTMWAWMGAVGIARQVGVVSPSYNVYRLREDCLEEYDPEYLDLLYRTSAYVCEMTRFSQGVWESRLRLYPDAFFQLCTLTPPITEQRKIVEQCRSEVRRIEQFGSRLGASIEKLKEHRTALIAAAVTGKIDVRGMGETSPPAPRPWGEGSGG
jgi:type I restriction enzyme S subunit